MRVATHSKTVAVFAQAAFALLTIDEAKFRAGRGYSFVQPCRRFVWDDRLEFRKEVVGICPAEVVATTE